MESVEDFSEPFKLDEFGLIDLEYNKRRTIHFLGQEWWDKAMSALESSNGKDAG